MPRSETRLVKKGAVSASAAVSPGLDGLTQPRSLRRVKG